ncbi:MAG: non-ribosomal peptide synthetase [Streptosporangiaceae bacterium]|jgi:amino acid adenylation domain-containing protein
MSDERNGGPPPDVLTRFRRAALAVPERTAVQAVDGQLSFAELEDRTARLAGALRARGIGRGDRVGVSMPRTSQLVVALLGVWRAGAAYVPLDPAYPARRLAFMAQDARLALLLGPDGAPGLSPWIETLGVGAALAARPARAAEVTLSSQDPAYVSYTSGSTGTPKGVQVSHGGVAALLAALESAGVYRAEPGVVGWNASVSFDASVQQWARVCRGDTLVVLDEAQRSDPARLAGVLAEYGVTDLDLTPSHWELLREPLSSGSVPRLFLGGEPVPPRTWQEIESAGIEAVNLYGPTECTVDCTAAWIEGRGPHLGGPLPGMRVYLLDDSLRPVAAGEAGELYVAGPQVAHGYLDRPGLTAGRFVADPFGRPGERMYRTGDRGMLGSGAVLEYAGRVDRQVKLRGFRIELGEVEGALARCPGVAAAAVTVHEGAAPGDRRLAGYVTGADGSPDTAAILAELRGMLPAHMIPATVTVLAALPISANGKVDYHALSLPLPSYPPRTAGGAGPGPGAAAADRLGEQVAEAWRKVLGLDSVEPADDFLRLGGHSLAALRVVHLLRRQLSVELQLRHLLDARDLADFTETVRQAAQAGATPRPALVGRRAGAR